MEPANRTEILKAEAAIREMVEEISRYSNHSRQAEVAVNSVAEATKELVTSREKLDRFFQKTQDELKKITATFTSETKNTAEHLVQSIDQQSKENNRLFQTNNQLQEFSIKFIKITQSLNSTIEENRLSLAERLESLEKILTPFKDTIIKQELTLNQFGNDFAQLKINLIDVQKNIQLLIQNLENLPVEFVEKILDDIIRLNREIIEKSIQCESNQILFINNFQNFQSKAIKISKWNMVLTVFNFLMIGAILFFSLTNFKF